MLAFIDNIKIYEQRRDVEKKFAVERSTMKYIKKDPKKESFLFTREGIRTPDLLVRSQTLYPAELLALI